MTPISTLKFRFGSEYVTFGDRSEAIVRPVPEARFIMAKQRSVGKSWWARWTIDPVDIEVLRRTFEDWEQERLAKMAEAYRRRILGVGVLRRVPVIIVLDDDDEEDFKKPIKKPLKVVYDFISVDPKSEEEKKEIKIRSKL